MALGINRYAIMRRHQPSPARGSGAALTRPSGSGASRLFFLVEGELLREGPGHAGSLAEALEVRLHRRPLREIDAGEGGPVEHDRQIRIGHREAVQQVVPAVEVIVEVSEAL